jgi:S-methylmethionine-dependent homocysteine/selenocysteine methylase
MSGKAYFHQKQDGLFYLTEGGIETEIMYRHGYKLREFCMFELIDNSAAMNDLHDMYRRYLDVAAKYRFGVLMAGLDYRASPDWAEKIGYSLVQLEEMQHRCIEFLRDVAKPYRDQVPSMVICGCCGPRGDAYSLNSEITALDAEDYHMTQLQTLKDCDVDLVWAATFNNAPEAVGISRAAHRVGIPLCVSFVVASNGRLKSGPSLRQAVETTDAEAGPSRPDFYGINCSHPDEFEEALDSGDWLSRIRAIRPNAAKMDKISLCKLGHIEEGDPVELGQQMGSLARRLPHIDIWGGCCGTWDKHFEEIARNIRMAHQDTGS